MQQIPLIFLRRKKIAQTISKDMLQTFHNQFHHSMIYILDEDGVKKNQPNVSLYQRLASGMELWIDAGPRTVDDVIDTVFAGASRVVIRPELWMEPSLQRVIEFIENEVMLFYRIDELKGDAEKSVLDKEAQGFVISLSKDTVLNQEEKNMLQELAQMKQTYVIDILGKNMSQLHILGLQGMIGDPRYLSSEM